jgi:hypothetical protein
VFLSRQSIMATIGKARRLAGAENASNMQQLARSSFGRNCFSWPFYPSHSRHNIYHFHFGDSWQVKAAYGGRKCLQNGNNFRDLRHLPGRMHFPGPSAIHSRFHLQRRTWLYYSSRKRHHRSGHPQRQRGQANEVEY